MKLFLVLTTLLFCGQVHAQDKVIDQWVKTVDAFRKNGKLTTRAYPDKTFVGALVGYYDNDSLVLINSVTDAEAAGTETLYYIKDGALQKVFIMAAVFDSNDEWNEYRSKHRRNENCLSCHLKPNCSITIITFQKEPVIEVFQNKIPVDLSREEKNEMINEVSRTYKELQVLLAKL